MASWIAACWSTSFTKAPGARHRNNRHICYLSSRRLAICTMKKLALLISFACITIGAYAQKQEEAPAFPFKGGIEHMTNFFKDSVIVSQDIIQRKATGLVTIKFTSDPLGRVS